MEDKLKQEGKEEVGKKKTEVVSTPKMRQIIIETDGDNIKLVKAEVGGKIELIGIFQNLIEFLRRPPQQ